MATDERAMDDAEVDAFLGRGGTGVLSLARSDVPYAAPVSYGYDRGARVFYLRLGFADGSEKRGFVEASAEGRLVVYGRRDGDWRSVIATGELEPIPDEEISVEVASRLREAELPLVDVWDEPPEDVRFELFRLRVERLTGRKAVERD